MVIKNSPTDAKYIPTVNNIILYLNFKISPFKYMINTKKRYDFTRIYLLI